MAIMDAKLEFFDGVTITAISGATQSGTNEVNIDNGSSEDAWGSTITPDIGEGGGLVANFRVGTAFSSSNSFRCNVYHHTSSGVTSGSVLGNIVFGSGTAAGNAGLAGSKQSFRLPPGTCNKWIGVQVSMITGASGAGTLDAWVGLDHETPTT